MRLNLLPAAFLATRAACAPLHDTSPEEIMADGYDNSYECFTTGLDQTFPLTWRSLIQLGAEEACREWIAKGVKHGEREYACQPGGWIHIDYEVEKIEADAEPVSFETCLENLMYIYMHCSKGGKSWGHGWYWV